jgi:hypothetical protein
VRQHRGANPGHMMAPSRRRQGVKCPRTGAGARVRGALERGEAWSRAGRTLDRGGARSRGSVPSNEAEPVRGKRTSSNGTDPARGRRASSSEAKPARGDLQEGRLGGPLRSLRHGPYPAWLGKVCLALLRVLSGDFPVVKGTPWAVPDISPRASVGLPLRLPQMLEPTDRTFFPPCFANAFRGAASVDPRV